MFFLGDIWVDFGFSWYCIVFGWIQLMKLLGWSLRGQGCSAFWSNMDGTVQKLAQMKDSWAHNPFMMTQKASERQSRKESLPHSPTPFHAEFEFWDEIQDQRPQGFCFLESQEHTECLVNFANSSKPLRDSPGCCVCLAVSFPSLLVAKHWTCRSKRTSQCQPTSPHAIGPVDENLLLKQERFEQRLGEYTGFWTSLERLCRWELGTTAAWPWNDGYRTKLIHSSTGWSYLKEFWNNPFLAKWISENRKTTFFITLPNGFLILRNGGQAVLHGPSSLFQADACHDEGGCWRAVGCLSWTIDWYNWV